LTKGEEGKDIVTVELKPKSAVFEPVPSKLKEGLSKELLDELEKGTYSKFHVIQTSRFMKGKL